MEANRAYLPLQHGDLQLILDPAHGGAIREFNRRGRPIFRPTPEHAGADPFDLACFPMVPYANRIAGGQFTFGTRSVQLDRNWRHDPHPLHGQGWRLPWTVVRSTASGATLMFEGGDDEWPWRYRSEQYCQLRANALVMTLAVENLAQSPMPVMLGLHPYFSDAARAVLQASVPRVWETDDASLPIKETTTSSAWSFDTPRPIATVPLDHCFVDWDGSATILWPDRRVTLQATNCRHLHVYAPSGRDFFCLEPLSAPVGELNRGAKNDSIVQPGQHYAIKVRFEVGDA